MGCLLQTRAKSRLRDEVDHHQLQNVGNVGDSALDVELAKNVYVTGNQGNHSFRSDRSSLAEEPFASRRLSIGSRLPRERRRFAEPAPCCSRRKDLRVLEAGVED